MKTLLFCSNEIEICSLYLVFNNTRFVKNGSESLMIDFSLPNIVPYELLHISFTINFVLQQLVRIELLEKY